MPTEGSRNKSETCGAKELVKASSNPSAMCLHGERGVFFESDYFQPCLLGGGAIAIQRCSFAQGVERLWHFRLQVIRALQLGECVGLSSLLEQGGTQAISGLGAPRSQLDLPAKLGFGF